MNKGSLRQKLSVLRSDFPALQLYTSWREVMTALHDRSTPSIAKDELLRQLLWTAQRDPAEDMNVILTLAFWPALESIHRQKSDWDSDEEEFWHVLYSTFLAVLHQVDVMVSQDRIASRVFNGTVNEMRRRYRRQWHRQSHERRLKPGAYAKLSESRVGEHEDSILQAVGGALAWRIVERLRRLGLISEEEFLLLLAVDLHGLPLVEYARREMLTAQTLKKRRQRAWAKIQRFQKSSNHARKSVP